MMHKHTAGKILMPSKNEHNVLFLPGGTFIRYFVTRKVTTTMFNIINLILRKNQQDMSVRELKLKLKVHKRQARPLYCPDTRDAGGGKVKPASWRWEFAMLSSG